MSYLRLTIGASDFSLEDFTYDDMPQGQEDPNLDNFSIAHDEMHVIPVANDILSINPEVKFMGSPWSMGNLTRTETFVHSFIQDRSMLRWYS